MRFGEPDSERTRYLLDRAVAGIGHYGNSIGVPNIGGEVYFEAPYETNCLVNAMALGIAKQDDIIRSAATGVGNVLVLFGASTGRDGIGGASVLASTELDSEDESKRPSVQVGDPFEESKLLECSLELLDKGLLVALQDLGAAGLTSAAPEMASKAGLGIDIDISKVPLREADMEPFEIMVSESQERMLCVCTPDKLDEVLALTEKWEVNGTAIGSVTDTGNVRIVDGDHELGVMPVVALVDDCPIYDLKPEAPKSQLYPAPKATLKGDESIHDTLLALLASPNIASRKPLFEQYDCLVQSRTARRPEEADAAVLVMPDDADGAIAVSHRLQRPQGRSRSVHRRADSGARMRVESRMRRRRAARHDQQPELREPREAAHRLADDRGCPWHRRRLLTARRADRRRQRLSVQRGRPTARSTRRRSSAWSACCPMRAWPAQSGFAEEGDYVGFAGWNLTPSLAASELAKLRGEPLPTELPAIDMIHQLKVLKAIREAVRRGELKSCHDVAEGGWLTATAEACLLGGIGCKLGGDEQYMTDEILFGESPCGFIVSGTKADLEKLAKKIPTDIFGQVGGDSLILGAESWTLAELREAHASLEPLFP